MSLAFPKPEKPVRGTSGARAYMSHVAQLDCICCARPSEVLHHPVHGRYARRRASDLDVLPMCVSHHLMLHGKPAAWRALFGSDADYIEPTRRAVEALIERTI
jgi:hypothetical protein